MQSKKDDERGIKRHRCDESSFFFGACAKAKHKERHPCMRRYLMDFEAV